MSADTRVERAGRRPDAASEEPGAETTGAERDYFTDAVPIEADLEQLEREERSRLMEQARARRSARLPTVRRSAVAILAVILLAGAVVALGRPSAHHAASAPPSSRAVAPTATRPPEAEPAIGLPPAVAVAPPRRVPRHHGRRAHRRRPHGRRHATAAPVEEETGARAAPESEPEIVVPPEAVAEPEPEPEPAAAKPQEPEPVITDAPTPEGASESSQSEADRQFGFGR